MTYIGPVEVDKCQKCGKPLDTPLHIKYGNDLDNPRKHEFIPTLERPTSTERPKSEWKPDDIVGSCDCGKGYVSFKKMSPEVQRALNGDERYKKMWEKLKKWFDKKWPNGTDDYGISKKMSELEQEGSQ